MFIVRRRRLGKFNVYTEEEAKKEGIEYKHWLLCKENEYCITDYGYVCIVRMVKDTKEGKCYYLPFGHYFTRNGIPKEKVLFKERSKNPNYKNKKGYYGFITKTKSRDSLRPLVILMARYYVMGKVPTREEEEEIARNFFKNQQNPYLAYKKTMKKEVVMEAIGSEMTKILAQYGVTEEFVVKEGFLESMNMAKNSKNGLLLLKTSVELAKLLNMYPEKTVVTDQLTMKGYRSIEDEIERESLELTRVRNEKQIQG